MWYKFAITRDEHIEFMKSQIEHLEAMKLAYPRKAEHIDQIIRKYQEAINAQPTQSIGKNKKPIDVSRHTAVPAGFHDRLRKTTFDIMGRSPDVAERLEVYHNEVPVDLLSSLDRLYLKYGDEMRKYFDPMREELRAKYGDTIKLFRCEDVKTKLQNKPLSAYTNSKVIAEQFMQPGRRVVQREIPIDAIWGASRFISDTGERPTEFWIENSKLGLSGEN